MEEKIDQVQKVSYDVYDFTANAIKTVVDFLKPAADVAMPVLKQAGGEAVRMATPVFSEASKKLKKRFKALVSILNQYTPLLRQ